MFQERLQAWKHACGYLEDYITATEKVQHTHAKEYEKVLKTINSPLKEGHHFDQSLGGVAGLFENMRSNTQAISNTHAETSKTLKGSVLPILDRLHSEIKSKNKELTKGAGKGSKAVDKAQKTTQKHIELLGQHTASYESTGGKVGAQEDPYVLHRQVHHRLNNQVQEENNSRQDLLSIQANFSKFEAHVLATMQTAIAQFNQVVGQQCEQVRTLYGDMTSNAQKIPPDFEWNGFVQHNRSLLIDPSAGPRSVNDLAFANQDHKSTKPLIAGTLERKTKILRKYDPGYWVVTPSKYLHEYKSDDDFAKDPVPETSLYLPDCTVGAIDGVKFNVKGKDVSNSSLSNKLATSHEYALRAMTDQEAAKWWETIRTCAGQVTSEKPATESTETSPIEKQEPVVAQSGTVPAPTAAAYTAAPTATTSGAATTAPYTVADSTSAAQTAAPTVEKTL